MLGLIPYWTWEIINIFEKDLKWGFHRKGSETKSGTQVTYSALIKTKILNVQKTKAADITIFFTFHIQDHRKINWPIKPEVSKSYFDYESLRFSTEIE